MLADVERAFAGKILLAMATLHVWRSKRPDFISSPCSAQPARQTRTTPGTLNDRWEVVEGEDVENPEVLEQHRMCLQMRLLGQGSLEGYTDHEFAPRAKSIDGLDGPPVEKGQAALLKLIATEKPAADEDEEPPPPDAPRCQCGHRARRNRVQIPGILFGRPYFRCAARNCRLMTFGELGSSELGQAMQWLRFQTDPSRASQCRYVVLGQEGFRPEDARFGSDAQSAGGCFVDAVATLAERPAALARLLPNALPGGEDPGGCHEVRLCVDGNWRAILVDERLPVRPAAGLSRCGSAEKNDHELLAFGRSAGNQLWLPLLEKAYAKAYGSYNFAFPGVAINEILADLTGACIQTVRLGIDDIHPDELWKHLCSLAGQGALIVFSSRVASGFVNEHPRKSVHALLGLGEADEPSLIDVGLTGCRALRLRNPRTGFNSGFSHADALASLRGTPAERSTHADGSFWTRFPNDSFAVFERIDICQAAAVGGAIAHSRSFKGEFTPEKGLGTRGCSLNVAAGSSAGVTTCWITVFQPTPRGARLLRPAVGRILNDLGIVVLNSTKEPRALVFGGASQSVTVQLELEAGEEIFAFPFSFRAWSGELTVRLQSTRPLRVRSAASESMGKIAWDAMLKDVANSQLSSPAPSISGNSNGCRSVHPLVSKEGAAVHGADVVLQHFDGGAIILVRNHASYAILVSCALNASYVALHTARGAQFGTWLEERNSTAFQSVRPDWRHYSAEDVVPRNSLQLLVVSFAVARHEWSFELVELAASEVPADLVSPRPESHPFAPRSIAAKLSERDWPPHAPGPHHGNISDEDEALRLAIEASLLDLGQEEARVIDTWPADATPEQRFQESEDVESDPARSNRWSRRTKPAKTVAKPTSITCIVCTGTGLQQATLSCCRGPICESCASHWAEVQEADQGAVTCPNCARPLCQEDLEALLAGNPRALQRLRSAKERHRTQVCGTPPTAHQLGIVVESLSRLGIKRCPGCGTGVQRETETCHKMICRTCRAKFCFRCLVRLEYFNCGCTGAEHRFVDPVDGRVVAHQ